MEQGMLNACQRYVCFVPTARTCRRSSIERARIYYRRIPSRSVRAFKVYRVPQQDRVSSGVYRSQLVQWTSLNVLGTYSEPRRRPATTQDENIERCSLVLRYSRSTSRIAEPMQRARTLRCDLLR